MTRFLLILSLLKLATPFVASIFLVPRRRCLHHVRGNCCSRHFVAIFLGVSLGIGFKAKYTCILGMCILLNFPPPPSGPSRTAVPSRYLHDRGFCCTITSDNVVLMSRTLIDPVVKVPGCKSGVNAVVFLPTRWPTFCSFSISQSWQIWNANGELNELKGEYENMHSN